MGRRDEFKEKTRNLFRRSNKTNEVVASSSSKKKSSSEAANPATTVDHLRETIEQLLKREEQIQTKIDILIKDAKTKVDSGDKRGALYNMKQKKILENEILKISNMRMTLEVQAMNIEGSVTNNSTINAMNLGKNQMKDMNHQCNIDKVEDIIDDIRDQIDIQNEINTALTQEIGYGGILMDEDELMAELDAEMNKTNNGTFHKIESASTYDTTDETVVSELSLPNVPTNNAFTANELEEEQAYWDNYD